LIWLFELLKESDLNNYVTKNFFYFTSCRYKQVAGLLLYGPVPFHARVAAYNLPPILVFSKSTPYFTGMLFHAQVAA